MNTKKSNLLNWRNKRTVETADPNAKVVLSDDTFVDFSELSTDPEVEKIEEEVEQLSETVTAQGEQLENVEDAVTVIEGKIPVEASSQNQLADKDFVNESVATASADFKGTYNSLQELEQVEANANDYGFVIVEDQYGNTRYDRYKYTEGEGWLFEYSINSVQFSSNQWNAINSGIDDSKVTKLNALPTKSQLDESLDTKANKSEMAVSTNADKTTITLKIGTSTEVINAHLDISGKVDKESGKGLSTNDYTSAEKTKLGDLPTNAELTTSLNTKVDKVSGKGLSSNDYTDAEKEKLGDLPTNAELLELLVTDNVPTAGSDNLVKSGGVASAISGAVDALDATVGSTTVASGKHVAVQIVETNGILTAVQIGENNIANATDLGDISSLDTQTKASVVSAINELVAKDVEIEEIVDLVNTVLGPNDAETFDPVDLYYTGDFVLYNDKLYKFTRNHTGAWDANDVIETNLFLEIDRMVKSDYEQVNIELKTETGEVLPNVEVVVTVEGEDAPRNLTTDNMGKCTTNIPKGVEYIVEANAIEDYAEPAKVIRRAALPKRYIEIVYSAILDVEHVVVEADYADTSLGTATEIYVEIDGEEFTIPLEGNQATFDVDFGKTYTISFQSVDGYMTPHTRTYKAMHASTKLVIARYMKPIDNVKWLMADGTLREVNNVTDEERLEGNIYGCVVGNSELVTNQKCYTIPTQYLLSGQYPYTGNYLSQNMQITAIGFYDTHGKALLDIDGEFNCTKIREFISEKASQGTNISSTIAQATYNTYGGYEEFNSNRDYYAGRSVVYEGSVYQFRSRHNKAEWNGNDVQMLYAGFDSSRSYMVGETVFRGGFLWTFKSAHNAGDAWNTSEVNRTNGWIMPDGTLKHAFTPAYGQLYAYRNIRNDLNTVTQSIFSAQCLPISGANIWTSTQSGAQHGVGLSNGSFYGYTKGSVIALLPVLAY